MIKPGLALFAVSGFLFLSDTNVHPADLGQGDGSVYVRICASGDFEPLGGSCLPVNGSDDNQGEYANVSNDKLYRMAAEKDPASKEGQEIVEVLKQRASSEFVSSVLNPAREKEMVGSAEFKLDQSTKTKLEQVIAGDETPADKFRAVQLLSNNLKRSGQSDASQALGPLLEFYQQWASPDDSNWGIGDNTKRISAGQALDNLGVKQSKFRITIQASPVYPLPSQFGMPDPNQSGSGTATPIQAVPVIPIAPTVPQSQTAPATPSSPTTTSQLPNSLNSATNTSLVTFNYKVTQDVLNGTIASVPVDGLTTRLQLTEEPSLPHTNQPKTDVGYNEDPHQCTTMNGGVCAITLSKNEVAHMAWSPPSSWIEAVSRLQNGSSAGQNLTNGVQFVTDLPRNFNLAPRVDRYDGGVARITDPAQWNDLAVGVPAGLRLSSNQFSIGDTQWGRLSYASKWDLQFNPHDYFAMRFGNLNYSPDFGGSEQPLVPGAQEPNDENLVEPIPTMTLTLH